MALKLSELVNNCNVDVGSRYPTVGELVISLEIFDLSQDPVSFFHSDIPCMPWYIWVESKPTCFTVWTQSPRLH